MSSSTSSIFHRSLDTVYPSACGGQGVYLVTRTGHKILDGSSGAAVSSVGHNHPEVISAIIEQTQNLSFAHTSFFTSDPAEYLASFLITESCGPEIFSKVCFLCSGSEAVESALKIARQYHVYRGEADRVNFIGRDHAYHGNTLGALAAGNNPARRPTFAPILSDAFHHVSRCFYDADGDGRTEEQYENDLIAEFEQKILDLGGKTVAGIIVEPVGGATLGGVPPTKHYLPRLRELCDKYGILLIYDEVMCGMGRTGSYHAWQSLGGAAPDLQTIGKGLGGGYQPLSAILIRPKVFAVFEEYSKGAQKFTSGHTFQGHPTACAAALKVQEILKRDHLIENVNRMGVLLENTLLQGLSPELKEAGAYVRGRGLFRALDFGRIGGSVGGQIASDVRNEAFELGAAVYPCSSAVDSVLFAPPFIISEEEIGVLANTVLKAVGHVIERRIGNLGNF